ncbi:MAG: UvrD-helicase domain-containing protein [Planctomycetota bacterium]|jgi:DNA helicase-2/ATP-dependent DNA helicase PcrA|nr:UvrD-helicase domain-containing protein [Planctomycetota bacterium]
MTLTDPGAGRHHLNPQQLEAVRHQAGPLMVIAGAGTGKTRVVTERIAALLGKGVRPENILGVTFTNKAAAEMRDRLKRLAGGEASLQQLTLSTFHSLCLRILRRDGEKLGFARDFAITDQGEQLSLVRKAVATVPVPDLPRPPQILSRISLWKNQGLSHRDCTRQAMEAVDMGVAAVYRRYQEQLDRQNALDFDDLILKTLELFQKEETVVNYWRGIFHYLMVDEFQDSNRQQFELVRLLAHPRENLAVVGDDDQSIYSWRGANSANLSQFMETYPQARLITLEQNYRSARGILKVANALINHNPGRREKNLWSDLGVGYVRLCLHNDQFSQAEAVVKAIRQEFSATGRFSDFAIIIRASSQSRPFEDELMAGRIPFEVIGGQRFYDRKEARDILSYLAVLAGPSSDNQLLRIINAPPRGIGEQSVDSLRQAGQKQRLSLSHLLAHPEAAQLAPPAAASCRQLAATLEKLRRQMRENGLAGLVAAILEDTGYIEEVRHLYKNPLEVASRWAEAREVGDSLVSFAERQPGGGKPDSAEMIREFIRETTLLGKADSGQARRDQVKIITVHSAKGLEYPFVFIPDLEEGIFPHKNSIEDNSLEEERRLLYVAMTRARRGLTLSHCRQRDNRGKLAPSLPSRFLAEIPEDGLERLVAPLPVEEVKMWIAKRRAEREGKGGV